MRPRTHYYEVQPIQQPEPIQQLEQNNLRLVINGDPVLHKRFFIIFLIQLSFDDWRYDFVIFSAVSFPSSWFKDVFSLSCLVKIPSFNDLSISLFIWEMSLIPSSKSSTKSSTASSTTIFGTSGTTILA